MVVSLPSPVVVVLLLLLLLQCLQRDSVGEDEGIPELMYICVFN